MKVIDKSNEIIEAFENFELADKVCAIIMVVALVGCIGLVIYEQIILNKRKKMLAEYKATLTKEQLEAIENYKKIAK